MLSFLNVKRGCPIQSVHLYLPMWGPNILGFRGVGIELTCHCGDWKPPEIPCRNWPADVGTQHSWVQGLNWPANGRISGGFQSPQWQVNSISTHLNPKMLFCGDPTHSPHIGRWSATPCSQAVSFHKGMQISKKQYGWQLCTSLLEFNSLDGPLGFW